jgi:mono/diheme cytochrome c family protein
MPSHFYRVLSERDLDALVFYLQRLPARRKPNPGVTELYIARSDIPPLPPINNPVPAPADDPVSQGKYLLTLGNCLTCHSPSQQGRLIKERYLAGGVKVTAPWGVVFTPNITPAAKTGIADYTEQEFIRLMREGIKRNGQQVFMNYMPWYAYKFMNDADLKAIYAYLMSVAPIENDVNRTENQFPLGN